MLKLGCAALAVAALALSGAASAEVKAAAPDGMILQFKGKMPLPRAESFQRVLAIGAWWADSHTYSGKASSLSIDPVAGGCWCEFWEGGEVEHGRVITVMNNQMIRFAAPLGPLQGLGVNGVLTLTLGDGADDGSTDITLDMVATGSALSGLDQMAPVVDGVLKEQFTRLIAPPVQP